jgi:hypothetical protein
MNGNLNMQFIVLSDEINNQNKITQDTISKSFLSIKSFQHFLDTFKIGYDKKFTYSNEDKIVQEITELFYNDKSRFAAYGFNRFVGFVSIILVNQDDISDRIELCDI